MIYQHDGSHLGQVPVRAGIDVTVSKCEHDLPLETLEEYWSVFGCQMISVHLAVTFSTASQSSNSMWHTDNASRRLLCHQHPEDELHRREVLTRFPRQATKPANEEVRKPGKQQDLRASELFTTWMSWEIMSASSSCKGRLGETSVISGQALGGTLLPLWQESLCSCPRSVADTLGFFRCETPNFRELLG